MTLCLSQNNVVTSVYVIFHLYISYHSSSSIFVDLISPVANVICYYTTSTMHTYFLSYLILFDTVDHEIMFRRLEILLGLRGKPLAWFAHISLHGRHVYMYLLRRLCLRFCACCLVCHRVQSWDRYRAPSMHYHYPFYSRQTWNTDRHVRGRYSTIRFRMMSRIWNRDRKLAYDFRNASVTCSPGWSQTSYN